LPISLFNQYVQLPTLQALASTLALNYIKENFQSSLLCFDRGKYSCKEYFIYVHTPKCGACGRDLTILI